MILWRCLSFFHKVDQIVHWLPFQRALCRFMITSYMKPTARVGWSTVPRKVITRAVWFKPRLPVYEQGLQFCSRWRIEISRWWKGCDTEDVFTDICNVLSLYMDTYLYINTTLDKYKVTDGLVVIAGVSVTWNVLSWSGGHEFKPRLGWIWGAWYFCPKSY